MYFLSELSGHKCVKNRIIHEVTTGLILVFFGEQGLISYAQYTKPPLLSVY